LTAGELMTRVLTDLRQMGASRQNLQSLLTQLEPRYKPMGLRSLRKIITPKRAPVLRLGAESTAEIEGHRVVHATNLPDYGAVTAIVSIDGVPFPHPSFRNIPGGPHVEQRIIRLLQVYISRMTSVPRSIEILISQSPCLHRCASPVAGLRALFPNTSVSVYFQTLYGSTSGIATEESMAAVQNVAAAGVHIYVWSGGGEIQSPDLTWLK
jgi:APOBEC-like protein